MTFVSEIVLPHPGVSSVPYPHRCVDTGPVFMWIDCMYMAGVFVQHLEQKVWYVGGQVPSATAKHALSL